MDAVKKQLKIWRIDNIIIAFVMSVTVSAFWEVRMHGFSLFIGFFFLIAVLITLCKAYKFNPFVSFEPIVFIIDITNKRNVDYDEYINNWVFNNENYDFKIERESHLSTWESNCKDIIDREIFFKKHRLNQYAIVKQQVTDYHYPIFQWNFVRYHTRYRQVNYQRYSYAVDDLDYIVQKSYIDTWELDAICEERIRQNEESFERTQRFLENNKYWLRSRSRSVGPKQRQRILRRDNFTCQLCGAKGPGAGGSAELEVDHKLPFSLGGSDKDSNLWTLCKDCNRGKSNDYID